MSDEKCSRCFKTGQNNKCPSPRHLVPVPFDEWVPPLSAGRFESRDNTGAAASVSEDGSGMITFAHDKSISFDSLIDLHLQIEGLVKAAKVHFVRGEIPVEVFRSDAEDRPDFLKAIARHPWISGFGMWWASARGKDATFDRLRRDMESDGFVNCKLVKP